MLNETRMRTFLPIFGIALLVGCTGDLVELNPGEDLAFGAAVDMAEGGGGELGPNTTHFVDIQADLDAKGYDCRDVTARGDGSMMYARKHGYRRGSRRELRERGAGRNSARRSVAALALSARWLRVGSRRYDAVRQHAGPDLPEVARVDKRRSAQVKAGRLLSAVLSVAILLATASAAFAASIEIKVCMMPRAAADLGGTHPRSAPGR